MPSTLSVPLTIEAKVHEIEGGGFWAEVPDFPGCVAYAETFEELRENVYQAIVDWRAELHEKTQEEALKLAAIQGTRELPDESYPQPYDHLPPPGWTDEDE
jgi:predicted RNase H-like HicB family nuclease